jgi:peptide/nickel transport system ATP-binding protein
MVTHDMAVHANLTDRVAIMYAGQLVEVAKTLDMFENPLHCYSKYLIGSLPKIGDKAYRVSAPGNPPVLSDPPPGCRFQDRCPEGSDRCCEETPPLREVAEGHTVACFRVFDKMGIS